MAIHVRDLKDFFVSTKLYRGELTMNDKTIEGYQKNGFCARILENVFEGAIKITGFFKLNNQKATTMFDDYRVLYEKLQSSILNLFQNPEPEGPLYQNFMMIEDETLRSLAHKALLSHVEKTSQNPYIKLSDRIDILDALEKKLSNHLSNILGLYILSLIPTEIDKQFNTKMEDSLFLTKLKFFGLLQTISPDEQTSLMDSLYKKVSASTSKAQFAKILDDCQKTCPSKPLKDGIQTFMNINKTLEDLNNTSSTSADALADDKMRCCLHMMNYITTHGQGYTSSNRATIDKKIEILTALISFVEQSTSLVDIQNGIQGIIDNNKEVTRKGFFSFLNPGPGKYQQCLNAALESISHSVRNARTDPFRIS